MSLTEDITRDMKEAMKAGDKLRLTTVRMLLSAVKNKAIELRSETLEDDDVRGVVRTLVRQRQDSVEQYTKGGRAELAEKEAKEIEILKAYLPPELSTEELRGIVEKAVEETGATGMKDMGKVMKAVMADVQGRADGKAVSQMVKEVLGG